MKMAEYLYEEDMNTGEYISRDLALRQLNDACLVTNCNNHNGVRCRACAYADAMDFIEAIPAADVQPVKHGHWEEEDIMPYDNFVVCSECGMNLSHQNYTKEEWQESFRYCPNCGARMDGDTK
jgi:transcription elongation factor Elf1